ncbi:MULTISPECIES: branched-chain amino acid ABC transporter permease [Burkholderia cepacia complex]|uniref:branched-chain amino acid ABC transporter permease n=1 Tax=Burkholderia cepacia complex TaxID=87882 RepID=UPI000F592E0F|nr:MULTISPECIES: branched-chain amino acid ABC transporter permease [Burkholderia cepacia complex]RQU90558.1 branched-chain amino acid ABC transporter permease [Burkholderia cenocepacia]RQV30304.1 branched-chain amino acid ABC transporter permease [Burkholderia cenocepacia]RQV88867.1 branched-chain amino acid ABC transporter permease [Burkholderia cenocepacia]RQZ91022.1 branched-chain amino acid ABC transporter permease [Burkholderia cepacia]RQZ98394.1 branched-chain amino acid ABC transporter
MESFVQQLVTGLSTGGIYACLALALVMIYQATHQVNFAQGEMAMFSTFIAWALIQAGVPYWGAFFLTIVLSFAMGAALEFVVIRPLHKAPELSVVVVFIGLLVIFHSLAGWLFGSQIKAFPSPFPKDAWFGSALMSAHQVGTIFVALCIVAALFTFFRFTTLGLAMRAAAQNPGSSRLLGIHVGRMLMLGWGLAGAIGAVAGMMIAPVVFLDPGMMSGVLIYAFAGALIGGIDNPVGAVIGGFLVGVLENLIGTYVVGTELKLSVALVLIVGVLIVRPAGLMGRRIVQRV